MYKTAEEMRQNPDTSTPILKKDQHVAVYKYYSLDGALRHTTRVEINKRDWGTERMVNGFRQAWSTGEGWNITAQEIFEGYVEGEKRQERSHARRQGC